MGREWVAPQGEPGRGGAAVLECAQASRLLGADPSLVLHGGGNSSVKDDTVLHVKASGYDMAVIGPDGFAPLDRRALDVLLARARVTDAEMVAGLRAALLDPTSANPSIETLLHHLLPHRVVLHTHADAIVTLTNTVGGQDLLAEALGPRVLFLGYSMPGFDLARLVLGEWRERGGPDVEGIVLAHHGLFTFDDDARTAYETHVRLVAAAERLVEERTGVTFGDDDEEEVVLEPDDPALRAFGDDVRATTGSDVLLRAVRSPALDAFLARPDLARVTQRGPATLEHVIRTQRTPLVGRDVAGYLAAYAAYVERNRARSPEPVTMLDPTPRVVLDRELGLVSTGRSEAQARIAGDVYSHTVRVITAAEALGGYVSITEGQAFDVEYWELEQAKLR